MIENITCTEAIEEFVDLMEKRRVILKSLHFCPDCEKMRTSKRSTLHCKKCKNLLQQAGWIEYNELVP